MKFWPNILVRVNVAVFAALLLWVIGLFEAPVLPLCTVPLAWLWLLSRSRPNGDPDGP